MKRYPGIIFDGVFQRFAKESRRASFLNEVYGSKLMSRENNVVIMAYWPSSSAILPTVNSNLPQSVGEIQFFLQHHLGVKGDHLFACVYWYQKHTNNDWYGSSATVCRPVFESDQSYCLIPIQRITSLCILWKNQCLIYSSTSS